MQESRTTPPCWNITATCGNSFTFEWIVIDVDRAEVDLPSQGHFRMAIQNRHGRELAVLEDGTGLAVEPGKITASILADNVKDGLCCTGNSYTIEVENKGSVWTILHGKINFIVA